MAKTNYDSMFGRMALDQKLCSESELQTCIDLSKNGSPDSPATLEDILMDQNFITKSQAQRLMKGITDSKKTADQIPGFKIQGKLGSGAMAVVYKANQLSLNRTVAIKVLPNKFAEKSNYVERFYKEGQLAATLNHNNIVQAIDVGEANGLYYFIMEYVEGKTIYDDLAAGKVFPERESLEIMLQLASALEHAHAQGLVHRDVKPKNIMINKAGVVKLADLGLARATSDIETAKNEKGKAFGTPYYIAPEQIRGEIDIDGRADIYGLGATFYHMVTGRVPFKADNPSDVMKKHLKEPLTPPDHINTSLSAGLSEIIETMMAKNRNERYDNPSDLLSDLRSVFNGDAPFLAKRKFDFETLEGLENGDAVEIKGEEAMFPASAFIKYKIGIVVMGAIILLLLMVTIFSN